MIFYEEPGATVYCGHVLKELACLPDSSVDSIMTSPPYWGLRKYKTEPQIWDDPGNCEHEWRGLRAGFCVKCNAWRGELGSEPAIKLYISHLMQIFDEIARVLKRTGTCWVNLDDSYASGKGTCFNPGGGRTSVPGINKRKDAGAYPLDRGNISMLKAEGLTPKSLCLIPSRFALAMAERGWILRNDIAWNKKNPMPESVKDRFTTAWEHLFFFTRARRYFFEQQFEAYIEALNRWGGDKLKRETPKTGAYKDMLKLGDSSALRAGNPIRPNELGRNKRDVWEIGTESYSGAHFATFPEKLCETPILAGCPKHGILLDPFCGSGRALAIAKKLGRKAIGIDLNPDYCLLAVKEIQKIPIPMALE